MAKSDVKTKIKPNLALTEPPFYKIIYLNDDVTSMDFVVTTLIEFFSYIEETAINVTENIHNDGSAVVAVLPYEIAEQKGLEITKLARENGYPLQIKIEPNED